MGSHRAWVTWSDRGEWQHDGGWGGSQFQTPSQKEHPQLFTDQTPLWGSQNYWGGWKRGSSAGTPMALGMNRLSDLAEKPLCLLTASGTGCAAGVQWLDSWLQEHTPFASKRVRNAALPSPEQPLSSHNSGSWPLKPLLRDSSHYTPTGQQQQQKQGGKQSLPHILLPNFTHMHIIGRLICKPNPGCKEPGICSF